MIRRTARVKEAMVQAVQLAIDEISHPGLAAVVPEPGDARDLARSLFWVQKLLLAEGRLEDKHEVMNVLQEAADFLSRREIVALPFAVNSSTIARTLREIVRDLK